MITLCSTDDRYRDDVHYRGGNILASDMLWWSSTMFAYNARPQDPAVVGEKWRENWLERIEETPPFVNAWLTHQRRDHYWKHGSINENYDQVNIPVFLVGGWQDAYTDAIFRMIEHLPNAKGLIGPWAHEYPEVATPEPTIGFLQEAVRFFDHWLKGKATGIDQEAKFQVWIQDAQKPAVTYDERPGRWIGLDHWPDDAVAPVNFYPNNQDLTPTAPKDDELLVSSVQEHGFYAGTFCPFGQPGDLPADQRLENSKSVVFTSAPLTETTDFLGEPVFHAKLKSDQANALIAVRIMDKAPTGESTLISWGMLNLNHHQSHEFPEALNVGEYYQIAVKCDSLGQQVPAGHQLEVALSPTYWTKAWPSPQPVTLTIQTGENTYLSMPKKRAGKEKKVRQFAVAETAPIIEREVLRKETRDYTITHEPISQTWTVTDYSDEGARRLLTNGIEHGSVNKNTYTITENEPLSATAECTFELTIGRGDWQTKLITYSKMTSDLTHFYLENNIDAYENEQHVTSTSWKEAIPRDFN